MTTPPTQSTWPNSHTFWRDKRVIVTGGSGFLGSFVVEKLHARGADYNDDMAGQSRTLKKYGNDRQ